MFKRDGHIRRTGDYFVVFAVLHIILILDNSLHVQGSKDDHSSEEEGSSTEVEGEFYIYRRFEKGYKSVMVNEGDTLDIYCNISGLRANETLDEIEIKYYKDDVILPDYWRLRWRSRALLKKDRVVVHSAHWFSYKNVNVSQRGEYKCEARGQSAVFTVRVQENLRPWWPFLIICAEVTVLCVITFLYELRQRKKARLQFWKDRAERIVS